MVDAMSTRYLLIVVVLLGLAVTAQGQQPEQKQQPQQEQKAQSESAAGTRISANLGPCSADFKVTDMAGKPLYNAKIKTQVRTGFLGMRKLDLEVGTDAGGRAQFVKLPAQVKKGPMTFTVTYGDQSAEFSYDPVTNCHAEYAVPLGKPPGEKP